MTISFILVSGLSLRNKHVQVGIDNYMPDKWKMLLFSFELRACTKYDVLVIWSVLSSVEKADISSPGDGPAGH